MSWTKADGSIRCKTTAQVFKYWRMDRAATALRVRRLKWYQKWALHPQQHANVVAAIFGDSTMDRLANIRRLLPGDRIGPDSTPMAKQYKEDLDALSLIDENMHEWYTRRRSDLHILTPGTEEWQQWTTMDPSILSSASRTWNNQAGDIDEGRADDQIAKAYWCDYP
eukprot:8194914-Pyramimonas_sp.AAC.1